MNTARAVTNETGDFLNFTHRVGTAGHGTSANPIDELTLYPVKSEDLVFLCRKMQFKNVVRIKRSIKINGICNAEFLTDKKIDYKKPGKWRPKFVAVEFTYKKKQIRIVAGCSIHRIGILGDKWAYYRTFEMVKKMMKGEQL